MYLVDCSAASMRAQDQACNAESCARLTLNVWAESGVAEVWAAMYLTENTNLKVRFASHMTALHNQGVWASMYASTGASSCSAGGTCRHSENGARPLGGWALALPRALRRYNSLDQPRSIRRDKHGRGSGGRIDLPGPDADQLRFGDQMTPAGLALVVAQMADDPDRQFMLWTMPKTRGEHGHRARRGMSGNLVIGKGGMQREGLLGPTNIAGS